MYVSQAPVLPFIPKKSQERKIQMKKNYKLHIKMKTFVEERSPTYTNNLLHQDVFRGLPHGTY